VSCAAAELLLVSSMGNDLIALDAKTGKERYRAKTGGPIFSGAHVDNGDALLRLRPTIRLRRRRADGKEQWKNELGGAVLAGPNVAQASSASARPTRRSTASMRPRPVLWTVQGSNMFQSQDRHRRRAILRRRMGQLLPLHRRQERQRAVDLELGKKQRLPNFSAFAPAITAPAVGNGKVFVSTNDGILHGLNISDGSEPGTSTGRRWAIPAPCFQDGRSTPR
jgi:outer membrane protein assembly factor BamB